MASVADGTYNADSPSMHLGSEILLTLLCFLFVIAAAAVVVVAEGKYSRCRCSDVYYFVYDFLLSD